MAGLVKRNQRLPSVWGRAKFSRSFISPGESRVFPVYLNGGKLVFMVFGEGQVMFHRRIQGAIHQGSVFVEKRCFWEIDPTWDGNSFRVKNKGQVGLSVVRAEFVGSAIGGD